MNLKMYAIANCDTVKKARKNLESRSVEYEFVDFKKNPPTEKLIKRWADFFGELPVNKKGITYKKFKDDYEALNTSEKIKFLCTNTSMIKRPILEKNEKTLFVGFDEENYNQLKL